MSEAVPSKRLEQQRTRIVDAARRAVVDDTAGLLFIRSQKTHVDGPVRTFRRLLPLIDRCFTGRV